MEKHSLVRTIYLYLFALLGLVLLTIGGVRFLDMGLKAFVFTKAEEENRISYKMPPVPYSISGIEKLQQEGEEGKEVCLSEDEKLRIDEWLVTYENWKEQREKIDPVTTRRHRDASMNLSLILVGLPLYFYHWTIIKKETRNKANNRK